jgi:hypothetical protein
MAVNRICNTLMVSAQYSQTNILRGQFSIFSNFKHRNCQGKNNYKNKTLLKKSNKIIIIWLFNNLVVRFYKTDHHLILFPG